MSGHSQNHIHIGGLGDVAPRHSDYLHRIHAMNLETQLPERHNTVHHRIKFKFGITALSWMQIIAGMLILNFEAIGSVLYLTNANSDETLHGTEYAGIYVSIFSEITGIIGLLSVRKKFSHVFRTCFHVIHIVLTVFLAVQAFGMACASAAMLVLFVASWDTILAFVNRVSHSVQLNLEVGTTTSSPEVPPEPTLPALIAAELAEDRRILVGLRSALFAIYVVLFMTAVVASCFGCCNYCKCWNSHSEASVQHRAPSIASVSSENGDSSKKKHNERVTGRTGHDAEHKKEKGHERHHHHNHHHTHNDTSRKH